MGFSSVRNQFESKANIYFTEIKKTPSKMDVAPWDKHWIKREFDGFGLYSMVFVETQWYSMVFIEIQWYSMIFIEIHWYSMVFVEIQWSS